MKSLRTVCLVAALVTVPCLALAQTTSICELTYDADGNCVADIAAVPVAPMYCVRGVVIAWKQYGNRGPGAIYDPISGCCISVFDIDLIPNYNAGDLVDVCGWLVSFNGLLEFVDNPVDGTQDPTVALVSSGNAFPCTRVSCASLQNGSATAEALESCAVEICGRFESTGNFAAASANYNFIGSDGQTCQVRIDSDTGIGGTPIPVGNVRVKGVLAQFDAGLSNCSGYQVLPRSLADFTPDNCVVAVEETSWGSVKSVFRDEDE